MYLTFQIRVGGVKNIRKRAGERAVTRIFSRAKWG